MLFAKLRSGYCLVDTAPSVVPSQMYMNDSLQSQPHVNLYDTVREAKASLASYLPSLKGTLLFHLLFRLVFHSIHFKLSPLAFWKSDISQLAYHGLPFGHSI